MPTAAPTPPPARLRLRAVGAALALLALAGCGTWPHELPHPWRTSVDKQLVVLPAVNVSNFLVIESKWDKHGPWRFLIDTGASVTLVSPALAARYAEKSGPPPATPLVRVKSAAGETALLTAVTLRRLELGEARFEQVQALVYDCAALSAHLGVRIDGVLGFPLFRDTLLTLDYPHERVLLQPRAFAGKIPGTAVPFNNDRRTPIINVRLGAQTFIALIDSGNDAALSLNPVGLAPEFIVPPRAGATVATLAGDREQLIGRLAGTLMVAGCAVEKPVTDLTDELSSLGGALLKNFAVTFDQEHNQVIFFRESASPVLPEARRSPGLSFVKSPAYWRVASVVAGSPAATAGVAPGDLVTRINGEPVAKWDLRRYDLLAATATEIAFTFLNGPHEDERRVRVFDLVP